MTCSRARTASPAKNATTSPRHWRPAVSRRRSTTTWPPRATSAVASSWPPFPSPTPRPPGASRPTTRRTTPGAAWAFRACAVTQKQIDELYRQASEGGRSARPGPPARGRTEPQPHARRRTRFDSSGAVGNEDFQRIISLLETRDAEAMVMVAQFLAQHRLIGELRIGPTGEVPEPASLVGAFSLVACDFQPTCPALRPRGPASLRLRRVLQRGQLRGAVRQLPRLALVVQPGHALSRRHSHRDRNAQLEPPRPPEADRRKVQRRSLTRRRRSSSTRFLRPTACVFPRAFPVRARAQPASTRTCRTTLRASARVL